MEYTQILDFTPRERTFPSLADIAKRTPVFFKLLFRYALPSFIKQWVHKAGENDFTILLGHAPDFIPDILHEEIDLCLAGHLHGGQVGIPIVERVIMKLILKELGSQFPAEWGSGYREAGNIRMNVSVGTGGSRAIRFNCPPTMTLFRVKKA